MSIRVLIIDDSATMRSLLMARLAGYEDIEVVGVAGDAQRGRAAIKALEPDVVTLDIELPGMNGLDFLDKVMALRPTPVIIVSSFTHARSNTTARALALGAVECYCKSDFSGHALDDGGRLAALIRLAALTRNPKRKSANANVPVLRGGSAETGTRLIAVGSSTGGVEALQVLLSSFPADCPPTLIVQHVDQRFTPAIARTLNETSPAQIILAEADVPLRRGHIYLAPGGDRHLMVSAAGVLRIKLKKGAPISGHCPSVDALFASVAREIGKDAVGILLTGMGADGARGLLAMAQSGAYTIAQDEASCAVFGMPRVAISLGAAQVVAPITRIAAHAFG